MTLNVNLEDVPFAILETVKARIMAQRRRLSEQQAARPLNKRSPYRVIHGVSNAFKRDEPAAPSVQRIMPVGHLWWFMHSEPVTNAGVVAGAYANLSTPRIRTETILAGYKRTSRLYCGNGSKYVEIVHGQQPQQMIPVYQGFPHNPDNPVSVAANVCIADAPGYGADRSELLILPAGKDCSIVVFVATNEKTAINVDVPVLGQATVNPDGSVIAPCGYPAAGALYNPTPGLPYAERPISGFSKVEQVSLVKRIFICSNAGIRELQAPAAFSYLLDQMLPLVTTNYTYKTNFVEGFTQYVAQSTASRYLRYLPASSVGFAGISSYTSSPGVFFDACSNSDPSKAAWQSLIGQLVRQFSSGQQWLIENTSSGAYAIPYILQSWDEIFNGNQPFKYGLWNEPGQEPQYEEDESYYFYPPQSFTEKPSRDFFLQEGRAALSSNWEDARLCTIWDWDDPSYCRQMCLALGFTDADLVP